MMLNSSCWIRSTQRKGMFVSLPWVKPQPAQWGLLSLHQLNHRCRLHKPCGQTSEPGRGGGLDSVEEASARSIFLLGSFLSPFWPSFSLSTQDHLLPPPPHTHIITFSRLPGKASSCSCYGLPWFQKCRNAKNVGSGTPKEAGQICVALRVGSPVALIFPTVHVLCPTEAVAYCLCKLSWGGPHVVWKSSALEASIGEQGICCTAWRLEGRQHGVMLSLTLINKDVGIQGPYKILRPLLCASHCCLCGSRPVFLMPSRAFCCWYITS